MHQSEYTNALISESSPYLLQHAHNHVNWHPWKEETLKQGKKKTSKSATIYVCSNKSCQTPTQNVNEAHTFTQ